jgi:hypothetical protein
LVLADSFHRSVEALPARAGRVAEALIERVFARPDRAPRQRGTLIYCVWSQHAGPYPAVRLFYRFDTKEVELLWIECYDDLKEREPYIRRWASIRGRGRKLPG